MSATELKHSLEEDEEELKLLDIVAHDLRAGLVPIKTYTQMLAAGILGPVAGKQAEALNAIDHAVDKQAERIAAALDLVRARQNKLEIEREPVVLEEVLKHALAQVERECKRRGIKVLTAFDPRGGVIEGDSPRLQRLFANLLSRAVRQSPQDSEVGLELRIVTENLTPNPFPEREGGKSSPSLSGKGLGVRFQAAQVRLWDRSNGILAPDLKVLFKYQAPQDGMANPPLDLSLAAAGAIFSAHHARLEVQPEAGRGTTYLIYLPLLKPVAAEKDEKSAE